MDDNTRKFIDESNASARKMREEAAHMSSTTKAQADDQLIKQIAQQSKLGKQIEELRNRVNATKRRFMRSTP